MPHARSNRGGTGANRTDLLRPSPEAVTAAPGQTYGEAAQQQLAQRAAPMGAAPIGIQPTPQPQAAPAMSALPGAPMVGANGPLTRPTERPNEPVTHGLPMGPGGGPEALQGIGAAARENAVEQGTLTHLLTNLAATPGATSAIKDLAARAQGGAM